MIAQVTTQRQKMRFLNACRGKPALGAVLPQALDIFGKSQRGRFFCAPSLALDVGKSTAWAAGGANPDELASFLQLCGCCRVRMEPTAAAPTSWQYAGPLYIFGLAAGQHLPLPNADEELLAGLRLDRAPAPGEVAAFMYADSPQQRDDFYSELCTYLARNKARVLALRQNGQIVCTVGAYALHAGQAYMACGQTLAPMRGRGIGGRLIVQMANELAAEGFKPVFACRAERERFYTRLGFERCGELAQYEIKQSGNARANKKDL